MIEVAQPIQPSDPNAENRMRIYPMHGEKRVSTTVCGGNQDVSTRSVCVA